MTRKVLPVCFIGLSLIFPNLVFAEILWDPQGVPICTQANTQWNEQLISDGQGGAFIAWEDERNGSNNGDIYMQRVDGQGNKLWLSTGVALTSNTNDQTVPQIVTDGAGGAIVVWLDSLPGSSPQSIYAQRIDGNGNFLWTNSGKLVCNISTNGIDDFQLLEDGNGGAFVTWADSRSGDDKVFAQHLNPQGNASWAANGIRICTASGAQASPASVSDGLGGLIITWDDTRVTFNHDIYTQRVDASGNTLWADAGVAICNAPGDQVSPSIVSDDLGGAEIFWTDERAGNDDIYGQRINQNGEVQWSSNGISVINTSNDQQLQETVSDGVSGAILAWTDSLNGDNYDLYSQRIDRNGNKLWISNGITVCNAPGNQLWLTMISDNAGGVIYTWPDTQNGARQIYLQRADSMGMFSYPQNGVIICPTPHLQIDSIMVKSDANTMVLVWGDEVSPTTADINLYAQKWKFPSATPTPTATSIIVSIFPTLAGNDMRAFPNPAKDLVHFVLGESQAEKARLEIFNITGERIAFLNISAPGKEVDWNAKGVAPGIYFCQIVLTVNGTERKLPIRKVAITK